MSQGLATAYQPLNENGDENSQDRYIQLVPDSSKAYQPINENADENPHDLHIQLVPDSNKARWNHIEDLDSFFSRVYHYHQRFGYTCICLEEMSSAFVALFVAGFVPWTLGCVDYVLLFSKHDKDVSLLDGMELSFTCLGSTWFGVCWLIVGIPVLLFRFTRMIYNIYQFYDIYNFYNIALKIPEKEILNLTWYDVQKKLLEVQKERQMCIHKQELTSLDVSNRILRFKNYMVALVNKDVLPTDIFGQRYFSNAMKWNYEALLFWAPWSPWKNNWHLHEEYKKVAYREELARKFAYRCRLLALVNLVCAPPVFIYGLVYLVFTYGEAMKREPGILGSRQFSLYGRLYTRHFNELNHEHNSRLCRAYRPAVKYMDSFRTPILEILAQTFLFVVGSITLYFILLGVYDEDIFMVDQYILLITLCGLIIPICKCLLPEENTIWHPQQLLTAVFANLHYLPSGWKQNAHTTSMMTRMNDLFQYKAVYILHEALSPLLTPYMLFCLAGRSHKVIDFFRNFTVDIAGVGDVCSFAQMDVGRHGNPGWHSRVDTSVSDILEEDPSPQEEPVPEQQARVQAQNGKTELSLMQYTLNNPNWQPPPKAKQFLEQVKQGTAKENSAAGAAALQTSLHSAHRMGDTIGAAALEIMCRSQSSSGMTEIVGQSLHPFLASTFSNTSDSLVQPLSRIPVRGSGVTLHEGPISVEAPEWTQPFLTSHLVDGRHAAMGISAIYLHELSTLQGAEEDTVSSPATERTRLLPT